jgi:hypothetical protein
MMLGVKGMMRPVPLSLDPPLRNVVGQAVEDNLLRIPKDMSIFMLGFTGLGISMRVSKIGETL